MRRWLVAAIAVAIVSVLVPTWATLWLVLGAVQDVEERREKQQDIRDEQIEAIRGAQECEIRLLLVPPEQRIGFTVSRILDACPGALPEREQGDDGSGVDGDEFDTGRYPESRQPWETAE